ncbi:hypothetical protein [Mucilaginibacter conchicola]|nr:hypothetical protein [Mucilaginibacter conchicola]
MRIAGTAFILLLLLLQSCLLETPPELKVTIVNNSPSDVLVSEYTCCDTAFIECEAQMLCEHALDTAFYPRVIKRGASEVLNTKMKAAVSIYAINLDSLKKYCGSTETIADKPWMKIFSNDVDKKAKSSHIEIK